MNDLILDTDVMIDLLRLHPAATAWLQSLSRFPATSCFTALELLGGSRDKREYWTVEKFLFKYTILYPSTTDLERSVYRYTPYCLSHGIGRLDLLIACVATGHNYTLADAKYKTLLPSARLTSNPALHKITV